MDDTYDVYEMDDYRRKAIREGNHPSFGHERLGAKRRIEHGIPNSPAPETVPSIEGRVLAPAVHRPDEKRFVSKYSGEARYPTVGEVAAENMGGHSMHTGDNGRDKNK